MLILDEPLNDTEKTPNPPSSQKKINKKAK